MKETRAALRYAKAILNLAKEKNLANVVNSDLQLITNTLENQKDFQVILLDPVIKSNVKKTILTKVFASKINGLTLGLINLLIENKRLDLLLDVAKEYVIIYDFDMGIEVAKVTTAVPLSKDLENKILKKVKSLTGKKVTIKNTVDPTVIGGFILRVEDKQYDASITGQLNVLKRDFEDNHYVPKY